MQIGPRFHHLDVVRRLLADAQANGAGGRYLIQHSAGSGKSNSIAWLAHQLIGLKKNDAAVFDSIIVVTDRKILDQQIRDTIQQAFADYYPTTVLAEETDPNNLFCTSNVALELRSLRSTIITRFIATTDLPPPAAPSPAASGWSNSYRVGYLPPTGVMRPFHGAPRKSGLLSCSSWWLIHILPQDERSIGFARH